MLHPGRIILGLYSTLERRILRYRRAAAGIRIIREAPGNAHCNHTGPVSGWHRGLEFPSDKFSLAGISGEIGEIRPVRRGGDHDGLREKLP
jgi:hypothetical protein